MFTYRRSKVVQLVAAYSAYILLNSCCIAMSPIAPHQLYKPFTKQQRRQSNSRPSISSPRYNTILHTAIDRLLSALSSTKDTHQSSIQEKPTIRVEKAPNNARRIFAAVDIPTNVDNVWNVLTDYENLHKFVPSLVANEVLARYSGSRCDVDWQGRIRGGGGSNVLSSSDEKKINKHAKQCQMRTKQMKGAVLKQTGGTRVMGIRTTLEVREWPNGMPKLAHCNKEKKGRRSERYVFPRPPHTVSSIPHKDISMQNIDDEDGDFNIFQGVWRMQSIPGRKITRLTYAVEVSPRAYLPVALIEDRLSHDLIANLESIRDVCTKKKKCKR